jgi:hypothetical protein
MRVSHEYARKSEAAMHSTLLLHIAPSITTNLKIYHLRLAGGWKSSIA